MAITTLDATLPSDSSSLISDLGSIGRETRAKVNELIAAAPGYYSVTAVEMEALDTTLIIGTDIADNNFQLVELTAAAAVNLTNITNGFNGQVVTIIFGDADVTIKHDVTKIILNGDADFNAQPGDVIQLLNQDGDQSGVEGTWREMFRTLKV